MEAKKAAIRNVRVVHKGFDGWIDCSEYHIKTSGIKRVSVCVLVITQQNIHLLLRTVVAVVLNVFFRSISSRFVVWLVFKNAFRNYSFLFGCFDFLRNTKGIFLVATNDLFHFIFRMFNSTEKYQAISKNVHQNKRIMLSCSIYFFPLSSSPWKKKRSRKRKKELWFVRLFYLCLDFYFKFYSFFSLRAANEESGRKKFDSQTKTNTSNRGWPCSRIGCVFLCDQIAMQATKTTDIYIYMKTQYAFRSKIYLATIGIVVLIENEFVPLT